MSFVPRLVATGLYVGYAPVAPGTAGSVLGVLLYWLIPKSESLYFAIVILLLFFVGTWAASYVEKTTKIKDNQVIVIDEIVGVLITLFCFDKNLKWLAIGCILFRLFDIVKPYPANVVERLPSGWGVMADDVVAGIYSAICLRLLFLIFN